MKKIGLLGGMSWESTALYYRAINEEVALRLGGLHSAELLIDSLDFAPMEQLQVAGDWDAAGADLARRAVGLQAAGADLLVLATNTMHLVAPAIEAAVDIPLLHIADPTGTDLVASGHHRVGLLATRFTMEQDFYRDRLTQNFGLDVVVPDADDREIVHRIIYDELCMGIVRDESRERYREVIARLVDAGVDAIIFGCTEITMLVGPEDSAVPTFDTTALHALGAVETALA
ncbi:aspartate/glutamate racemase family protein [soil metagenome]